MNDSRCHVFVSKNAVNVKGIAPRFVGAKADAASERKKVEVMMPWRKSGTRMVNAGKSGVCEGGSG